MLIAKKERITDKPKTSMIRVRVDDELLSKLDELVERNNSSRSHVIRDGIEQLYRGIK